MIKPFGFQRISRTVFDEIIQSYGKIASIKVKTLTKQMLESPQLKNHLSKLDARFNRTAKVTKMYGSDAILFKIDDYTNGGLYFYPTDGRLTFWSCGEYLIAMHENFYDGINDKHCDFSPCVWKLLKKINWQYREFKSHKDLDEWLKLQPKIHYDELVVCNTPCAIRYYLK